MRARRLVDDVSAVSLRRLHVDRPDELVRYRPTTEVEHCPSKRRPACEVCPFACLRLVVAWHLSHCSAALRAVGNGSLSIRPRRALVHICMRPCAHTRSDSYMRIMLARTRTHAALRGVRWISAGRSGARHIHKHRHQAGERVGHTAEDARCDARAHFVRPLQQRRTRHASRWHVVPQG